MYCLAEVVNYPDVFVNIAHFLSVKEIAYTRRVCKTWYEDGKKAIKIYQVGLSNDGWSKWDEDKEKTIGWGMRISIDFRGTIRGANKNNGAHSHTAQSKVYTGQKKGKNITVNVVFPDTDQVNSYDGVIEDGTWKGTFELIKSCGSRKSGSKGITEGVVLEC